MLEAELNRSSTVMSKMGLTGRTYTRDAYASKHIWYKLVPSLNLFPITCPTRAIIAYIAPGVLKPDAMTAVNNKRPLFQVDRAPQSGDSRLEDVLKISSGKCGGLAPCLINARGLSDDAQYLVPVSSLSLKAL
jgi:hypothetical protein